jgi:Protein of unknown function (DUF2892).
MKIEKNLATADKIVRLVVSAIIIILFAFDLIGGPTAAGLFALSVVLIATSVVSFCPVYRVLGLKNEKDSSP